MIIRFLGTSAGWPLPRLGCNCKICRSKDPKDKRSRPALLVDEKILIDAGPDIYHELIDQNPEKIEAVVITHDHWDHTYGLSDLGKIYGIKRKIALISTNDVLKSLKRHQGYTPYFSSFKLQPIKPFKPIELCGIEIDLFPVLHSKSTPTYALSLKAINHRRPPGRWTPRDTSQVDSTTTGKCVYIPDYKTIPHKSLKKLKNTEILILDGSGFVKMFNHASIGEGIAVAKKAKTQKAYFTHIGHKTNTHEELTQYVQHHGGKGFHIAYDGLEMVIS